MTKAPQSWRDILRQGLNSFLELAVPMVVGAALVILFILLEAVIMKVAEVFLIAPRPPVVKDRLEPVFDAISFWSAMGALIYYILYVIGELIKQFINIWRR